MLQRKRLMDGDRNRAVVVSVARYNPGVPLKPRPGAKKDEKRLHRTLSRLGFKVELHSDLSGDEIYQMCKTEDFVSVLSLQACRGDDLDDGVEVDSAVENSSSQYLSVPIDTAVMYATAPGYGAFMHPLGSVFLQTFCTLLEEEGNQNLELTRLMTRLSHRVAYTFQAKGRVLGGKKEMPCLLTRLTREVFPFAEPEKDGRTTGISATELVDPENVRRRTHSIS
uniref:Caspase 3, apoptosis-related cysteine peptidase-like n=1 Tax=Amphiprion ocellaris TaxID=80972 RepID=A0AAQ5YJ58_AMPOC